MTLFANQKIRVKEDVYTYIYRSLPSKGEIFVQVGQEVNPEEILGNCQVLAGYRKINLAKSLGVSPKDVGKYLKKNLTERIYKDELLAFKPGGLFLEKKIIISPTDGILDSLDLKTGELKLKFMPHKINIPAGVFGIVDFIDKARSEVGIRTQVTQIFAPLGSGRARSGIIKIISRNNLMDISSISLALADHIIVAGSLIYKDALQAAVSVGVSGIIVGGINAKDYKGMSGGRIILPPKMGSDIGISVLISEGFGSLPIGVDIFDVLKKFEGRFAILDGNSNVLNLPSCEKNCINKIRKVSLGQHVTGIRQVAEDIEARVLKVSQNLRIIAHPFMGEQGQLQSIDKSPTRLDSGIVTYMLNVAIGLRKIRVPYTNVEII